jgi:predicted amidohydrolase
MHVACCQFDIAWEDKPANYAKVEAMVGGAGLAPGTLLLLPEMFATGFSMSGAAIAEPPDGPTANCLLFDPDGRMLSRYAKMHLFGLAGESGPYGAGDVPGGLPLPQCAGQVAICYDLRFPELFRTAHGPRPELLAVIANWPALREPHWLALLKARAIENQAYVAAVNRCGCDPDLTYPGRSQILDPHGNVLADAGDGERVIRADLDLDALRVYRERLPFLRDIRQDLTRREE